MLDRDPIRSPWNDAARAICEGDLVRAAGLIDGIGHTAAGAYAWLRAAEALEAAGQEAEAAAQYARAEPFYREVGAARFVREPTLQRTIRDRGPWEDPFRRGPSKETVGTASNQGPRVSAAARLRVPRRTWR